MIKLKNVSKKFAANNIYQDFNLEIESGKITVILGESGTGKTTLLKMIASLESYNGEITGVEERPSLVFQNDRLVKNLTVLENVKLTSPYLNEEKIIKMLTEFGLAGYENAYPKILSGGMARRVAIVRALANK